jgi:SNF2 family DNA or RNA helicase
MLSRENLHAYQERAVAFIQEKRRCGLFLDMGLGKTSSTLTAISDLRDSFAIHKVLVIAPLRVANSVWAQEARKWSHLKHLKVSVCTGSQKARLVALQADADVFVINRENIPWLVETLGAKWPFDMVIIDESSSFKNASSQRFKALRRVLPQTEYMVLLTGTPSPNGLLDIWAQMYLIDFGHSLGRTMSAFKQRFFEPDYMGYKFAPREGSADKIHGLMAPSVIHMSAEDYLELPSRIDLIERVDMPPAVLENYNDFEKTLFTELEDGEEVEAMTAAVLANKLLQYANGAMYTNEDGRWSVVHDEKLDALGEIIEDNQGENILVAYTYRSDLERLKKRFPEAVVLDKAQETIDHWNRGEIKMLLAHPASAGHGLNLQDGGATIVWFGLTWSLELYQQFNARLHRQGQLKPVKILHVIARKTIDERVLGVLSSKDATQKQLLSALKPNQVQQKEPKCVSKSS